MATNSFEDLLSTSFEDLPSTASDQAGAFWDFSATTLHTKPLSTASDRAGAFKNFFGLTHC
jgi:hypothetical protein